jgi:hypothetical protein
MRFKGVPSLVAATTGAAIIGCSRLRMWMRPSATSAKSMPPAAGKSTALLPWRRRDGGHGRAAGRPDGALWPRFNQGAEND